MSTKKCSYKGCGSYTNSTRPTTETFYSFPKHPERLKLWMKLGGVSNEKDLPYVARYFCSKHFDETKYVANNPRRKQLLSTAVPYQCMESSLSDQNEITTIVDESDYQCVVSSMHPIADEYEVNESIKLHEEISEEVANEINCISESVETLEGYEEEYQNEENCQTDFEEAIEIEKKAIKRKLECSMVKQPLFQTGPTKRSVAIISSRPTSTMNVYQHQSQKLEEKELYEECELSNNLPEANNVTTFIFKGEEYVQMPKEQYIRERMAMINKIKSYEEILKNVKHLMDSVKI